MGAVSCDTGSELWEVRNKVEGKAIHPHGLLVGDNYNSRILVLNPINGSFLQSIRLPPQVGRPELMWFNRDQMVLLSMIGTDYQISFFSVQ